MRTEFQIAGSTIAEESFLEDDIRRFRIYTLGVETQCFTISFSFEIIIPLFLEVLSDFFSRIVT